jgi:hypothetical protein
MLPLPGATDEDGVRAALWKTKESRANNLDSDSWLSGASATGAADPSLTLRAPTNFVSLLSFAAAVYYPLARFALVLEKLGCKADAFPLSYYRSRSFYTMRTDALDRFGTRLEQRFTAGQIRCMMQTTGLVGITFSPAPPYWCAVGFKSRNKSPAVPRGRSSL